MSNSLKLNSFGSCCSSCEPCCIPYGQISESCFGSEVEAIPQSIPLLPSTNPPVCKKKTIKKKKVLPNMVYSPYFHNKMMVPRTQITRKVKAGVLYSTWECCKRNGIQDETPQWLVLGRPYRRPGPSYRCRLSYYPNNNQCN